MSTTGRSHDLAESVPARERNQTQHNEKVVIPPGAEGSSAPPDDFAWILGIDSVNKVVRIDSNRLAHLCGSTDYC